MRLTTLVVGVLCGFPLYEAANIWPRIHPAIETDHRLDRRVVVEPPKAPPKIVDPGAVPKEGQPAPGQSCARSWLWRRACTPPTNPHAAPGSSPGGTDPESSSGGSSSGGSHDSRISTLSERLQKVDRTPGYDQVLPPAEYVARGKQLLTENDAAISANPRVDKAWPHWSIRYERTLVTDTAGGVVPATGLRGGENVDFGVRDVLAHADIGLNIDVPWTSVIYTSKGEITDAEREGRTPDSVAIVLVSKNQGALLASDSDSAADKYYPGPRAPDVPKVPNSELLYQTWEDENMRLTPSMEDLPNLRFIIRWPIVNKGTQLTIKDAYNAKGYDLNTKQTFYPTDDANFDGLIGDVWSGITGTVNGRPSALMTTDHALSLRGLKVIKIHAWYRIPGFKEKSALIPELGRI